MTLFRKWGSWTGSQWATKGGPIQIIFNVFQNIPYYCLCLDWCVFFAQANLSACVGISESCALIVNGSALLFWLCDQACRLFRPTGGCQQPLPSFSSLSQFPYMSSWYHDPPCLFPLQLPLVIHGGKMWDCCDDWGANHCSNRHGLYNLNPWRYCRPTLRTDSSVPLELEAP